MFRQDREQGFAKAALALMGECNVVSTPDNFELFYAYSSGENPAVTNMMAAVINARKPFTPELLQDLRLRSYDGVREALKPAATEAASGPVSLEGCCPPSGMTALYLAWKESVRRTEQGVFVARPE